MLLILNASVDFFNRSGKSESSLQLLTKLFHEINGLNFTMQTRWKTRLKIFFILKDNEKTDLTGKT